VTLETIPRALQLSNLRCACSRSEVQNQACFWEELGNSIRDREDHLLGLVSDDFLSFLDIGVELDNTLQGELSIHSQDLALWHGVDENQLNIREHVLADADSALRLGFLQASDDLCRVHIWTAHGDELHEGVERTTNDVRCVRLHSTNKLEVAFIRKSASSLGNACGKLNLVSTRSDAVNGEGLDDGRRACARRIAVDGDVNGVVQNLFLILEHDAGNNSLHQFDGSTTNKLVSPVKLHAMLGDGVGFLGPADLDPREVATLVDAETTAFGIRTGNLRVINPEGLERGGAGDGTGGCDDLVDVSNAVQLCPQGSLLEQDREQDGGPWTIALEEVFTRRRVDTLLRVTVDDDTGSFQLTLECVKLVLSF